MAIAPSLSAATLIERLALARHAEGGWFRETYRDSGGDGRRGAITHIYYLLEAGERSAWHRIDATEIWHFNLGAPLVLSIATDGRTSETVVLGPDLMGGEVGHAVVPPGCWQAAESRGAWSLVGCTVAPAFLFSGFELAPEGWAPSVA